MTFLLQKFNAINRTRTEVRARNGLRPTASGIAFTGRLSGLPVAGGLPGCGVRDGAGAPCSPYGGRGSISVAIGDQQQVHHYLIDTDGDGDYSDETLSAAGTNPTGQGGTVVNTFLVGGILPWLLGPPEIPARSWSPRFQRADSRSPRLRMVTLTFLLCQRDNNVGTPSRIRNHVGQCALGLTGVADNAAAAGRYGGPQPDAEGRHVERV